MSREHISETAPPCPRCFPLAFNDKIRLETLQPVPDGAWAPLGPNGIKCCYDCAAADLVLRLGIAPSFVAARIAVGNDRQEQYRLPGIPMGLVQSHLMKPSAPGDFKKQLAWLDKQGFGAAQLYSQLEEED